MTFAISVYSDVICPWCYIGKRRLERALDGLGIRQETAVEWLPFELNPDMPEGGMARAAYRNAKFGAERAAAFDRDLATQGEQEGIAFAFDRMARTPNTRKAHRLIAFASGSGRGDDVKSALLAAYFEEARDVGDPEVLVAVASSCGLDEAEARAALDDRQIDASVAELERQAARIGVSGVPFFIVDRSWAVSGAQPSETWMDALRERLTVPSEAAG